MIPGYRLNRNAHATYIVYELMTDMSSRFYRKHGTHNQHVVCRNVSTSKGVQVQRFLTCDLTLVTTFLGSRAWYGFERVWYGVDIVWNGLCLKLYQSHINMVPILAPYQLCWCFDMVCKHQLQEMVSPCVSGSQLWHSYSSYSPSFRDCPKFNCSDPTSG